MVTLTLKARAIIKGNFMCKSALAFKDNPPECNAAAADDNKILKNTSAMTHLIMMMRRSRVMLVRSGLKHRLMKVRGTRA